MRTKMTRQPTHPGDIIKFDYLEPLALKVTALAERLGIWPWIINSLLT